MRAGGGARAISVRSAQHEARPANRSLLRRRHFLCLLEMVVVSVIYVCCAERGAETALFAIVAIV